jgi:hypothetical protein
MERASPLRVDDVGSSFRKAHVFWVNVTSYAAPIVAGIAALVWSANPNLTVAQVKQILLDTATPMDINSGAYGFGRVNAEAAVLKAIAMKDVCEIGSVSYQNLSDALNAVQSGQTIKLKANVDYNSSVVISNKTITFDVNGFILNIFGTAPDGNALEVNNAGQVNLIDTSMTRTGKLNAIGAGTGNGVYVTGGSNAAVTSATGGSSGGVWANNGSITVERTITASPYIVLGSLCTEFELDAGINTGTGYLMYTDGISTVWVKITTGAPGSGDLNGDGVVTMDEAMIVIRVVVGIGMVFTTEQFAAVDMDFDGCITMNDVMMIIRRVVGL